MTKKEFLQNLAARLEGLPTEDIRKSLDFYGEMLDDRMEEGVAEAEAVAALGSMEDIVEKILAEIPLAKLVGHKWKARRGLNGLEVALLIIGFPLWFPLLLVAGVLALSLLIVFWSLSLVLYVVVAALALGGVALALYAPVQIIFIGASSGLLFLGGGLVAAGLSIPFFFLANCVFKGLVKGCKGMGIALKRLIIGKEKVK